jgi:heme exporter protein C
VYAVRLRVLGIAAIAATIAAGLMIFLYAPQEADQGLIQKIFYLHVPMAILALCGYVAAALMAAMHLRSRDRLWDVRSYITIHLSLILSVAVLVTGSVWARASWGHWWVWNEPMLVSFLIVFLLYATYQPLRFSISDPERQSRYASVFALVAGGFIPLNFLAVRMAQPYTHPRVLSAGGGMSVQMWLTFVVSLAAMTLLLTTLWNIEMAAKGDAQRLRRARRAAAEREPAARAVPV